jgi:hypothetical protein
MLRKLKWFYLWMALTYYSWNRLNILHHKSKAIMKKNTGFKKKLFYNKCKEDCCNVNAQQNRSPTWPTVAFRNINIHYKLESRFMGIIITENLKLNAHVCSLSLNLSKVCYLIKLLKEITSSWMIRGIYYSEFQSLSRHGIIFWELVINVCLHSNYKRGLCG